MSIADRQVLIKDFEFKIGEVLTVTQVNEVMRILVEQLDNYSVEANFSDKDRTVYLDNVALLYLKRYLDSRTDDIPALFIGQRGERLEPSGVRYMLRKVKERCGVDRVHPHKFRRTFATNLINRGMPIQDVAAILGHTKIDTTMKYVYIDRRSLKNAYHKFA